MCKYASFNTELIHAEIHDSAMLDAEGDVPLPTMIRLQSTNYSVCQKNLTCNVNIGPHHIYAQTFGQKNGSTTSHSVNSESELSWAHFGLWRSERLYVYRTRTNTHTDYNSVAINADVGDVEK